MKVVFLTGAGISAESGITTFRDRNGLWKTHNIEDVASTKGWQSNRKLVNEFYNQRRAQLKIVEPNDAHLAIAELENQAEVLVITTNVDDLHERAGSKNVLHFHGELRKAKCQNCGFSIPWYDDILDEKCPVDGGYMRPDVVWFGEQVHDLNETQLRFVNQCDYYVQIGTSAVVYPAASIIKLAVKAYTIEINPEPASNHTFDLTIPKSAVSSVRRICANILENIK